MDDPRPLDELRFNQVLVALDRSESAELALAAAVTIARRDRAVLTLMTVVSNVATQTASWVAGGPDPQRLQEDVDTEAQRLLRDTVARIPEDVTVRTVLRHGKAGPEIVAQADAGDYDAILLGARGRGRVGTALGSVSNHVMHHAAVPVFVAHAPTIHWG